MATFTFSFTYPDDKVLEFAKFLGYPEMIDEYSENDEGVRTRTEISNPQSPNEFLREQATAHINQFTTKYANYRKQMDMQAKAKEVEQAYNTGVIAQIQNSLVSTIE